MKIVQLTTDAREHYGTYEREAPYFGTAPEALLEGFAGLPDAEVHVVTCARVPMRSPEKLADNIWFHSLVVPKIGWMRTGYLGCIRAVRRKLRELQPDIVHGQGTERDNAMCAVFSGYPNVLTLHGVMREMAILLRARRGSFHWLAAWMEGFAIRRTAGVFCNSAYTEEKVRPIARRTWRVPNAVRQVFFETPPSNASRPAQPVFVNVGVVNVYKRQNELLDVFDRLREGGLQFEVQFLGMASRDTAYGARFLDRVQNRPGWSYHGFKSVSELIAHYDGATAMVHVSAIESFGLVVAEALARDMKFFGFRVGGVPDIAAGVPGAELVADGDWAGLERAIRAWMKAGAPRPDGAAGLMKARYHPRTIALRHLEIYREVLSTVS